MDMMKLRAPSPSVATINVSHTISIPATMARPASPESRLDRPTATPVINLPAKGRMRSMNPVTSSWISQCNCRTPHPGTED